MHARLVFGALSLFLFPIFIFAQEIDFSDLVELPGVSVEDSSNPAIDSVVVLDEFEENEVVFINVDGRRGRSARNAIRYGTTPQSGASGTSGGHMTLLVRRLPKKVIISARGGDGGLGGDGAPGKKGAPGRDGRNAGFFRRAKAGKNGGDGGNAGDGSHGGHGGNGGYVRIVYIPESAADFEEDWTSRFEVNVDGGRGGEAGRAGLAGRPGPAGKGGKKFWSRKREADGQPGRPGLPGRPGRQGEDGEVGEVVFLESEHLEDWVVDEYLREDNLN